MLKPVDLKLEERIADGSYVPVNRSNVCGDTYSDEETVRRREAALKRLLNTPPQPRTKKEPGERVKRGRPRKDVRDDD